MMNSTQQNPSSSPERDVELLSAYLDNQLSVAERIHIERRMEAEPALRVELEGLRATVGALRDLEPVRPPRSFTLDPAKVARPRRISPFAWIMQAGSGLAGLALVLMATVQMMAFGAMPAAAPAAEMSTKQAPVAPTNGALMSAPAPAADTRMAEATQAPALESAPASSAFEPTAAPTVDPAAAAMVAPTNASTAMDVPEASAGNAGGAAPPSGAAGGAPPVDQTTEPITASESSSPGTSDLPAAEVPVAAQPQGIPPGLTLAVGVALMGLAAAWYLAGRRA
jgi:hypothetical protein